mmetsp:Transcript_5490/g.13758  ORF Transcript_5490/g.13758 Transcript_5490/m.13758 type:complete len:204 (-) Transcript_5490:99-710(-)
MCFANIVRAMVAHVDVARDRLLLGGIIPIQSSSSCSRTYSRCSVLYSNLTDRIRIRAVPIHHCLLAARLLQIFACIEQERRRGNSSLQISFFEFGHQLFILRGRCHLHRFLRRCRCRRWRFRCGCCLWFRRCRLRRWQGEPSGSRLRRRSGRQPAGRRRSRRCGRLRRQCGQRCPVVAIVQGGFFQSIVSDNVAIGDLGPTGE